MKENKNNVKRNERDKETALESKAKLYYTIISSSLSSSTSPSS